MNEFAIRWNYVLPNYPPENYDYKTKLLKEKLNVVQYDVFTRLKNHPQAQGLCKNIEE